LLAYPNVSLDTNHLKREIRAIAMGRKAWLFYWTEVGARYVGIVQNLLASYWRQGVDPSSITPIIDRLQISPSPASRGTLDGSEEGMRARMDHDVGQHFGAFPLPACCSMRAA
jgi:hypothetical protein